MPRRVFLPDWVWVALIVSTILGSWLADTVWFIFGLVVLLLIQGIYVFHFVRCPTCRERLVFISGTTRYRVQLTCPRCQNLWDTGKVREDDEFFNS